MNKLTGVSPMTKDSSNTEIKPPDEIWEENKEAVEGGLVEELSGTVVNWLQSDGAHIEKEDELVEIEVIKTSMTLEAPTSGTLEILVDEGEEFKPEDALGRIG